MKPFLFAAAAALAATTATAQIPNSSFENWSNTSGYNNPDGWNTLNPMTTSMSVYTATQGTPGNPGSSYLKLVSKTVSGMGVMPGIAATGQINTTTMKVTGGFPMTTRPQSLTGNWQYMGGSASDQGLVAVYLTKWDMAMMKRDTVASGVSQLTGMAMSWNNFTQSLTYFKGFNPDTALIILSSSGATPVANSYLYVDNLAFSGSVAPTGIQGTDAFAGRLKLFPNPSKGTMILSFGSKSAQAVSIRITDVAGRTIAERKEQVIKGNNDIRIDTRAYSPGTYLLHLSDGENEASQKFIVE